MYFIVRLLITMVAILIIAYLVPKVIQVESWIAALVHVDDGGLTQCNREFASSAVS